MMLDEPGDRIVDLFNSETIPKQVQALLNTFLALGFGWSLSEVGVKLVDKFSR